MGKYPLCVECGKPLTFDDEIENGRCHRCLQGENLEDIPIENLKKEKIQHTDVDRDRLQEERG